METLVIAPKGVCSRRMVVEHENGRIVSLKVEGGCPGNLNGISKLVEGMEVEEVVKRLTGVRCRGVTSCPDQLAQGLKTLLK